MEDDEWESAWKSLVDKEANEGYQSLTADERILFNIESLIIAADDGGIISFYYNSGAEHMEETIEDLRSIKATNIIKMLKRINALFPNGRPSTNIDERNLVISSWYNGKKDAKYENLLEKMDDKFYSQQEDLELKLVPIIRKVMAQST